MCFLTLELFVIPAIEMKSRFRVLDLEVIDVMHIMMAIGKGTKLHEGLDSNLIGLV